MNSVIYPRYVKLIETCLNVPEYAPDWVLSCSMNLISNQPLNPILQATVEITSLIPGSSPAFWGILYIVRQPGNEASNNTTLLTCIPLIEKPL